MTANDNHQFPSALCVSNDPEQHRMGWAVKKGLIGTALSTCNSYHKTFRVRILFAKTMPVTTHKAFALYSQRVSLKVAKDHNKSIGYPGCRPGKRNANFKHFMPSLVYILLWHLQHIQYVVPPWRDIAARLLLFSLHILSTANGCPMAPFSCNTKRGG